MIFQANQATDDGPEPTTPPRGGRVQHSIISNDLTITGDLISDGDITVHGVVEGSIKCRALTLGEAPTISKIEAETVRISGSFSGDVKAKQVVLTETAHVTGDIMHESLEVKPGASIEGKLSRIKSTKTNGKDKVTPLKSEPSDSD
ncbi:MAG: polymer-forming cytoskeletal protein [Rhodospirillales bacterium]|nr:polymer-forming cytoskeletal protein [Rhodospirillales bacterium]MDH3916636.1 polymer-forming cytoskeletal protein [Rhodospirillales bacterium]